MFDDILPHFPQEFQHPAATEPLSGGQRKLVTRQLARDSMSPASVPHDIRAIFAYPINHRLATWPKML